MFKSGGRKTSGLAYLWTVFKTKVTNMDPPPRPRDDKKSACLFGPECLNRKGEQGAAGTEASIKKLKTSSSRYIIHK